jgi:type IV pilus assembly protein PilV
MKSTIKQSGFSLLELLIALIVFSVGLLAVAGLQTVSKQSNFESVQRTTASQIATGMLEDIRTNGSSAAIYSGSGSIGGGSRGLLPAPDCAAGADCNPAQKAAFDLWFWEQALDGNMEMTGGAGAGGLVLPTMCVAGPAGGGAGIYAVTVVWRGSATLSNQSANACGTASGNYGAQNEFRRVVQIPTFIDPNF